ncbi:MAG: fasciclin domain-containing protein [Psychroflexus sp.]
MKKTTNFTQLLMISLLFFGFSSCSDDDDAAQVIVNEPTTFEIIADSPDHEVLEQALIDNGLDEALNEGTYTVFAPTDDAFESVDISGLSSEQLTNILLNHVVEGAAESADLSNSYLETLATESISGNENNLSLYVNVDAGVSLNGVSTVTDADKSASNGVVHVVDAIIPIPDLTTFATADPNFENLELALTRDDQPDFVATLSATDSPAPFTVFAPTNAAFAQLLESTDFETLADVPTDLLTEILNYHVIADAYVSSSDLTSGEVSTLGGDITIDAENATITDANGRTIQIEVTDVNTANGVIHAIDMVILPSL